ncbi:MAG: R3H domain-containing nucleic acid-binding protein [Patescibacteria group bacterium]
MANRPTETILEELLKLMNVAFDSIERIESAESKHTRFLVRTKEPQLLIGTNGEHLGALNYIIRRITSKGSAVDVQEKFLVDVNDYHEKTLENLKIKAKIMADRAISFKLDVELDPMSSYERMLIHSFLDGQPNIKTESKGEGASRRLVIKYISG